MHGAYGRFVRPLVNREIDRQRLKLLWKVWGYWALISDTPLPWRDRLRLLQRFLVIDWHVEHAHSPAEISVISRTLALRPAASGEIVVEAGCWQGGSSAKLSIVCRLLGYSLHIFDSFEGVERMTDEEKSTSYDFSGEYASPESTLRRNLDRYGEPSVCTIHKGWYKETLLDHPLPHPVRLAFIDCDLATGTREALSAIVPALTSDGSVYTHDYHCPPVRDLLNRAATWADYGRGQPVVTEHSFYLASLRFPGTDPAGR